jgi:hypothetical protein
MSTQEENKLEERKWLDTRSLNFAHRAHDRNDALISEARKAALSHAGAATKTALLVNGGALIAIASLFEKFKGNAGMANGSQAFVSGVFFAALSAVLTYASIHSASSSLGAKQYSYDPADFVLKTPKSRAWGTIASVCGWTAFVLCVFSVMCFLAGTYFIRQAIFS